MEITSIVKERKREMTAYTKNGMPLLELLRNHDMASSYVLVVKSPIYVGQVDFSRMLLKIPEISSYSNWSQVETLIDDAKAWAYKTDMVMPYLMWDKDNDGKTHLVETAFNIPNTESVKVHSCSHETGFEVHYGSKDWPARDDYYAKFKLLELIVKPVQTFPPVDINQSLPIVNGSVCLPLIFEGEMYIENSSKLMASTNGRNKDISLIDFTPFGGVSFVPFRDCAITKISDTKVKVALPANISFEGKTVMMSLVNRLFFPHEFDVRSNTEVAVDFVQLGVDALTLSDKFTRSDYIFNTDNYKSKGMRDYVDNELMADDNSSDFFILVNSPNLRTITTPYDITICQQGRIFPKRATGLLINNSTREVVQYNLIKYDHKYLITKTRDNLYSRILRNNPTDLTTLIGFDKNNNRWYDSALYKNKIKHTLLDLAGLV